MQSATAPASPAAPVSPAAPPSPAATAGTAPAAGAAARNWLTRRRGATTPQLLSLVMVGLVLASLAWGAVGAWTAGLHSTGATEVVSSGGPLSMEARQLYQSLSDADVTATTAFLSGPQEALAMRQRYQADVAQAGTDLSDLTAAAAANAEPGLQARLAALSTGLPVYTGYVAAAQSDYALGYQLTGGSFMQVASEQMHLTLLPAARGVYADANASLADRSAQASGLPWVVVMLVVSAGLGLVLYRTQRWLSRRTQRTFNLGLLAATLVMTIAAAWLLISFVVARSDLQNAETHGSQPVQALAQAATAAQRARGDEILNLISRSGSTSFQGDFAAAQRQIGPGSGTLLAAAAGADQGSTAAGPVSAAGSAARSFYAVGARVFSLDVAASYAAETRLVIGTGPASSAAGFSALESDLTAAITDNQAVFAADASAGANAFAGLEIAIIVAALLMAAGTTWGLSQRLGEYR
jgi:hypothetical protein